MIIYFFFFQAEDGIRDKLVTGVQTCALPICPAAPAAPAGAAGPVPGTPHHRRPARVTGGRLPTSFAPSFRYQFVPPSVCTPPAPGTGRLTDAQFPAAAVYLLPTARTIR